MKMNKKEAFAHFGIKQTNEHWSWAGIKEDKSLVVLTIWTDQRNYEQGGRFTTSTFNANNEIWKDHLGNKERIEIIQYCIEHLDSKFRVIWCVPADPNVFEDTREVDDAIPFKKKWFRITEFDQETGEFSSESIEEN